MFRDYIVHYKGKLVGIFRDYNEAGALKQAKMKIGNASRYTSTNDSDFVVQKYGLL